MLDEVGYLPLEQMDATFLFQVVSRRYEAGKPMKILREIRTLVLDDKYVLGAPARDTAPPPSQTYAEWLESEVKPISK